MDNKNKIIGINALFLIPNNVGGTEYHLRSFLKYLEKIDTENSYVVFCNEENFETFSFKSQKWQKVLCPIRSENRIARILYEQLVFPFVVSRHGCTHLHSYGYFGPVFGDFKKVVTVHDCNWLDHPEDTSKLQNFILDILIRVSVKTADLILTDSDFALKRLSHYFPNEKDKTQVIEPGIDDEFRKLLLQESIPLIKQHYILSVSAFYPHKNMLYLLDLWERFAVSNPDIHLIVVGQNGADEEKFTKKITSLKRTHFHRKVDYRNLLSLYKNAKCFIFPSVYEGFGYPVYEALAAEIPTIVGNGSLYLQKVRPQLEELTFELDEDTKLINHSLSSHKFEKQQVKIPTYELGVRKLIKLFREAV